MRFLLSTLLIRYPVIGWLLGAIGVVMIVIGMSQLHAFHHIQDAGVKTQGTLMSLQGEEGSKADIAYAFEVNGKRYTGSSEVGAQERGGLHVGDKIEARYLASDPAQNVTGASWPSTPYAYNLVGATLLFLPLAAAIRRRRMR